MSGDSSQVLPPHDLVALRQNRYPDPTEQAVIREAIAEAEAHLGDLYGSAGERNVAQKLRSHIDVLSSQLAPIRRLPPEILSSVFMAPTFPPVAPKGLQAVVGRALDPIVAVCSHWRATALATPEFWSTFSVSLSAKNEVSMDLLNLYLERSKSYPLSLRIFTRNFRRVHRDILTRLLSTSERWSSLHLNFETRLLPLFSSLRGRLPYLESLSLRGSTETVDPTAPTLVETTDAFELAPKLCALECFISMEVVPPLPLIQLTSLSASRNAISLANHCPELDTLYCTTQSTGPEVVTNASTIHASTAVLRTLTSPKLVFLRVVGVGSQWSQPEFSSFLQRSGCTACLHTLVLEEILMHANDIIALLPLLPALRTLNLRKLRPYTITDAVLHALTLITPSHANNVLPELETLIISGSYFFGNLFLLAMLESRAAQLRTVILELREREREFDAPEMGRFRAFSAGGISISVKRWVGKGYVFLV
ncbi:hypothetical protein B0H16DRAFT_1604994 [Mycena metata]|uniref:F-box domain-containing protein n=1 Tax=Mycena metata TaxID=1033252 RepID=A0AAD7HHA4_9AGAR|nr:hypothetical protein B0H16DRAFT_1604994 [Mycena metata]